MLLSQASLSPSLRISGCGPCSCFILVSHKETLATSSTPVRFPHFGSRHFILNLKSSITPATCLPLRAPARLFSHSLLSGLCLAMEGHRPTRPSAQVHSQPGSSSGYTHLASPSLPLVILLPPLCNFSAWVAGDWVASETRPLVAEEEAPLLSC